MDENKQLRIEAAIFKAVMKTLLEVGEVGVKKTSIFGSNHSEANASRHQKAA